MFEFVFTMFEFLNYYMYFKLTFAVDLWLRTYDIKSFRGVRAKKV